VTSPPGPRRVLVPPERIERWAANFGTRHGEVTTEACGGGMRLAAADGAFATATLALPDQAPGGFATLGELADAAAGSLRVGVVLVRRGGAAVGVADGGRLTSSKIERRYVQGQTAAGGWSQHRFARRRDNQTDEMLGAAAAQARRLVVPEAARLRALVVGGDRLLLQRLRARPELAALAGLPEIQVPVTTDPRLAVLQQAVADARALRVDIHDPG
jgi:VLRF1 release factor-like protein